MEHNARKKSHRIRKQITLPPITNVCIQLIAEDNGCSESETINQIVRHYVETEKPEILEKARICLNALV